jgi:hypothetical protein
MNPPRGKVFAIVLLFAAVTLVAASGAFTSVSAERTATVDVAADSQAFLALFANGSSPNGGFATNDTGPNGELTIDISTTQSGGSGVNPNAVTNVDDVFVIQNQGTQPVDVTITDDNGAVTFYDTAASTTGSAPYSLTSLEGGNTVELGVGDSVSVGVQVDTTGGTLSPSTTVAVTVTAEAVEPTSTPTLPGGGPELSPFT